MSCEKCWSDAYFLSRISGRSQSEEYSDLIKERECSEREQAGQFWDEKLQCDSRKNKEIKNSMDNLEPLFANAHGAVLMIGREIFIAQRNADGDMNDLQRAILPQIELAGSILRNAERAFITCVLKLREGSIHRGGASL